MIGRGKAAARRAPAPGFTLVEILLVLALIALFSTVLITGASGLFPSEGKADAETVILTSLQAARSEAVISGQPVALRIEAKEHRVVWGGDAAVFPEEEKMQLVQPQSDATVLIGGVLMETPLDQVKVYPDGTCDPLRVQIVKGQQTRTLVIDPWTCAELPGKDA